MIDKKIRGKAFEKAIKRCEEEGINYNKMSPEDLEYMIKEEEDKIMIDKKMSQKDNQTIAERVGAGLLIVAAFFLG